MNDDAIATTKEPVKTIGTIIIVVAFYWYVLADIHEISSCSQHLFIACIKFL